MLSGEPWCQADPTGNSRPWIATQRLFHPEAGGWADLSLHGWIISHSSVTACSPPPSTLYFLTRPLCPDTVLPRDQAWAASCLCTLWRMHIPPWGKSEQSTTSICYTSFSPLQNANNHNYLGWSLWVRNGIVKACCIWSSCRGTLVDESD